MQKYLELLAMEEEKREFNARIGQRIRARRIETGTPVKRMAEVLGYYHINSVYKMERGGVQIAPWHLHKLSILMKTNPLWLMAGV